MNVIVTSKRCVHKISLLQHKTKGLV